MNVWVISRFFRELICTFWPIYLSVCNLHIYRLPKNRFGIQSSRGYFAFLHFEIGGPRVKTNRDEFLDNTYDTDRI